MGGSTEINDGSNPSQSGDNGDGGGGNGDGAGNGSESQSTSLDDLIASLKILDAELHERHLGGGYARIMENAAKLAAEGFPVEFRMPLVPGYTDTPANVEAVIELLRRLGHQAIHLLAYHDMGEAKIDIIRGKQPKLGLPRYSPERLCELRENFKARGIEILNDARSPSS